ncbi:MAG: efflux RND transporter periplasmic adaptor subunit [Bacillota bacterium]
MRMKKSMILLVLAIPMLLTGCLQTEANVKEAESNSIPVEVMKVETSTIAKEYYTVGKLSASEEVNIASKVKGTVSRVYYQVGDHVKKGATLYTLDNSDLLNDTDLTKSKLNKSLADAKMKYEDALKNYNNINELYKGGAVSKNELDNATLSYNQAQLNYEQAQKDLTSNTKSLDDSISDTIIKSPIDGVVAQRNIEEGEMTGTIDFVIVTTNPMVVNANVSEDVINAIRIGDEVKVKIQSGIEEEYTGRVKTISPVGSNNSNIYPVEIEMVNDEQHLKPGMFAEVFFQMEKLENQIQIPKKSILNKGKENYVYIVKDNMPTKILVKQGEVNHGLVQIQKGLTSGDLLVVKGQEYLDDKSKIKIVNQGDQKQ